MSTEPSARRKRRFTRAAIPRAIQLTERRDVPFLRHVAEHRFASSEQLIALDGGNKANILARLRDLYDNRFFDRPRAQTLRMRPAPFVYALGVRGAQFLRERGYPVRKVDWREKNERVGEPFIEHALGVTEFMTRLEIACRKTKGSAGLVRNVEIIPKKDILAEAPTQPSGTRNPLRWAVEYMERGKRTEDAVVPDQLFGLRFDVEEQPCEPTHFLFELDRGTIPIERRDPRQRSIARKLLTYYEGWKIGRHVELFGIENIRVTFLTTSPERVEHMLVALDEITAGKGSGFFLFGDLQSMAGDDPLSYPWTDGRGDKVRLTD